MSASVRSKRGGARPGSGQPRVADSKRKKPRSIQLTDDQFATATSVGGGNPSRGVRVMIDAYPGKENAS